MRRRGGKVEGGQRRWGGRRERGEKMRRRDAPRRLETTEREGGGEGAGGGQFTTCRILPNHLSKPQKPQKSQKPLGFAQSLSNFTPEYFMVRKGNQPSLGCRERHKIKSIFSDVIVRIGKVEPEGRPVVRYGPSFSEVKITGLFDGSTVPFLTNNPVIDYFSRLFLIFFCHLTS